ncbi:Uncharacterised protein [Nocardia africana]|uniref:Uncharacterized protein n=1 Tax=Nocardia africana TaxID=134964 RepID=A0A378WV00_9NOCA|nr:Uncharacterised protein [Nocardia africana]
MRTDLDRALAVVQAAIAFDWTWTTDDLPAFTHRVGWQVEGLDPPTITTNFDVNRTDAMAYLDHKPDPSARGRSTASATTTPTSRSTTRASNRNSTTRSTQSPPEYTNSRGKS